MAEQGGFFRRIFSFGQKPDADRRAEAENLDAAPDIGASRPQSPDNDTHHPAAASTDTDTEAGANAADTATGHTEPLHPSAPPEGATTEKKTPNS